jgi:hypothetical protein
MVSRQAFINKIRELGYTYITQQKRTYLWRKRGTTEYISVPMRDLLEDEYVTSALRQKGVPQTEIDAFLASAKS